MEHARQSPGSAASSVSFVRGLVAGVVLINVFVFGVVAFLLYQSFAEFEERTESTAQTMAQLLAMDLAGDIDKIDLALRSTADELERQLARGGIDTPATNAFLARQQARLPEIFSLRATDSAGIVRYGLGVDSGARQNNADREYFVRQRDDPKAGLVIAKPVFTRLDQAWAVPMSRAIHLPNGSFGGVVYVNVGLAQLAKTFSAVDVGQHGSVSLRDQAQRVFAIYPPPREMSKLIGEKFVIPELQEIIQAARVFGAYRTSHTIDGVDRKFAAHQLQDYPLYVVVGRATAEYRARWTDQAMQTSWLAALFSLTTLISSWWIFRNWKRRLAATAELAREEEKFHTVADYTYDWEYWEGPGRELIYMSLSCDRVTGYSQSEFMADPALLQRIIHPDDQPLMAGHRHDTQDEQEAAVDFRIVRRDGEVRWIAHGCRSVFGRGGKFMGRRASNRDVTERKQSENEIRQAYAYNRSLIDASLDPLVTIGPDGKITDVNSATETVTGRARGELIGTEFSAYFSDPDKARAGYRQVFSEGKVRDYELEIRHADGHLTPVLYNAATYRDDDGKVIGVFAAARDISERKRAEAAVHQLNGELEQRVVLRTAQLEAANKELQEFSYSISHDLRTPLRAIAGFAQILADEHSRGLDSEGLRLLDVVRTNTVRMGQLIDELLEFLQVSQRSMEFRPVDMAQLAQEVFAELQAAVPERQLRLELKDPPPLCGDRGMMRRLLKNLLSNAIKFTRPRAAAIIEVGGSRDGDEKHYYVKDNGVGFDMRYVNKLFKVFEHAHPAGQFEGSGTGLAMARRIVGRHGGRIWAEGQVDTGATIYFNMPEREGDNDTVK